MAVVVEEEEAVAVVVVVVVVVVAVVVAAAAAVVVVVVAVVFVVVVVVLWFVDFVLCLDLSQHFLRATGKDADACKTRWVQPHGQGLNNVFQLGIAGFGFAFAALARFSWN